MFYINLSIAVALYLSLVTCPVAVCGTVNIIADSLETQLT